MDSGKLLLVEDNNDVREVFQMILANHGFDVIECTDGATAVDQARMSEPSVAIIDVGLPDFDGYQVALRIRKIESDLSRRPSILVALTGRTEASSRRKSVEAGFDLHFSKPVELKTICAEIKALQMAARRNERFDAA